MKNVLIINQKGGVGKTLIADELAFSFERDGIPFNFYDLDKQGSAIHETSTREDAVVSVIDTPGALQSELPDWIEAADFIIVPTTLGRSEMKPLETMVKILEPFKGKKPVLFVFNCWEHDTMSSDFIKWFNSKYPDLKTTTISKTVQLKKAASYGISINDFRKKNVTCNQLNYIYSSVKYELNLKDERTA